jgi:hypothetical protein
VSTTSEVEIVIRGQDKSDSAFRSAKNNEDRLKAAAAEAGISLEVMGQRGERAGRATSDGADRARDGVRRLDSGIAELNRGLDVLRTKFAETGDADFLRQGKRLSAARKELEGFKRELEALVGSGGGFLSKALDQVSGTAPTGLVQWLVAGGVAAAPLVGAAINAGVLAGIGTGGIAAGIALQASDPQVKAAAVHLGDTVKTGLIDATKPWAKHISDALKTAEGQFTARLLPEIQRDFDSLLPHVDRLTNGVIGLATHAWPGLSHAFQDSGPVVDTLADHLPQIGDAVSDMFDAFARGGPGARQALDDLLTSTEALLRWTGLMIEGTSKVYEWLRKLGQTGAVGFLLDLTESGDKTSKSFQRLKDDAGEVSTQIASTADDFGKLIAAANDTTASFDTAARTWTDKILNSMLSADQATLGFAEAQNHLSDVLAKTGIDMDIAHDKSQQMREGLLAVVAANIKTYDTNIAVGMSAQDAAAAYDEGTDSLINQMQQAGFTSAQIDELIGKYRGVPAKVDTIIATQGLAEAIDHLTDLLAKLFHVDGYVARSSVIVTTSYVENRSGTFNQQVPYAARHAAGGAASGLTWVGEQGPELLRVPSGSQVYSAQDSMRMTAAAAQPAGGPMAVTFNFTGSTDDPLARDIQKALRTGQLQLTADLTTGRVKAA